jgi:hypothetical protein
MEWLTTMLFRRSNFQLTIQKTVSLTDLAGFSVASDSGCVLNASEKASLTKPRKALLKLTVYSYSTDTKLSYCKNCSAQIEKGS